MALALMTVLLFRYNSRLLGKKISTLPIASESDGSGFNYHFGIIDKEVQQNLWGVTKNDFKSYSLIQSFDDRAKTVELSSSVSEMISVQKIMDIVEKALHLSNVTKVVRKMSGSSSVLQYKFFPFMSSVSSLYFSNLTADTFTLTKLDDLIHSWKMKRYPVTWDCNL